jgi:demethylmenaquinone methyltransferase/2-methoxy-6-polyprenyl-1,4-benzoquinol methylase
MSALPAPADKATAVREMFDRISPRYDRVNRVMTFNADQRWRRSLVQRLGVAAGDRVLDLACGTGDFAQICGDTGAKVVALDFSRGMLVAGTRRHAGAFPFVQGDALRLPLADGAFSVAVSGFALRNFTSIPPVLVELARVLEPGGRLGLLEVDRPRSRVVAAGHGLYFNHVVPLVGGVVGGERQAYRYLPQSASYLPAQDELVRMLVDAGFHRIQKRSPLFGAAQAVTAVRR